MVLAADFNFEPPLVPFERFARSATDPRSETDRRCVGLVDERVFTRGSGFDSFAVADRRRSGLGAAFGACSGTDTTIGGTPGGVGGVLPAATAGGAPVRRRSSSIRFRRRSSVRSAREDVPEAAACRRDFAAISRFCRFAARRARISSRFRCNSSSRAVAPRVGLPLDAVAPRAFFASRFFRFSAALAKPPTTA